MDRTSVIGFHMTARFLITSSFILFAALLLPIGASALTIDVQGAQILPASASIPSVCADMQITGFTQFVYDGELHSFEVTVPDSSYVVVAGALNGSNIPLNFITRYNDAANGVRMHVDVPSTSMEEGASIMLTLLSGKGVGKQVCAAVATITLPSEVRAPVKSAPAARSNWQREDTGGISSEVSQGKKEVTPTDNTASSTPTLMTRVQKRLDATCAVPGATSRLWTVLLALYLLVVAAAILAQPPFKIDTRSSVLLGAAIVVPLLILFAIWKISPVCHPGKWAPLFAALIATFGFVAGFRRHPSFKKLMQIFSLPEA